MWGSRPRGSQGQGGCCGLRGLELIRQPFSHPNGQGWTRGWPWFGVGQVDLLDGRTAKLHREGPECGGDRGTAVFAAGYQHGRALPHTQQGIGLDCILNFRKVCCWLTSPSPPTPVWWAHTHAHAHACSRTHTETQDFLYKAVTYKPRHPYLFSINSSSASGRPPLCSCRAERGDPSGCCLASALRLEQREAGDPSPVHHVPLRAAPGDPCTTCPPPPQSCPDPGLPPPATALSASDLPRDLPPPPARQDAGHSGSRPCLQPHRHLDLGRGVLGVLSLLPWSLWSWALQSRLCLRPLTPIPQRRADAFRGRRGEEGVPRQ